MANELDGRHTVVAQHAEATFRQIKALNRRRLAATHRAERDAVDAEIAQAKAAWWESVKHLMARKRA